MQQVFTVISNTNEQLEPILIQEFNLIQFI